MIAISIDLERTCEELKTRRGRLFKRYLERPHQVELSLEIRTLDDRIAECTERLRLERKRQQQ